MKIPSLLTVLGWAILILLGAWGLFYYHCVRPFTAGYMLNTIAPSYIDQAEDFFYTNQELIKQLETFFPDLDELDDDGDYSDYRYIFFPIGEYQSDLPTEIIEILSKMKVTPEERYVFSINKAGIRFWLEVETRLWIEILYDAPRMNQREIERWVDLDDHWSIRARYLVLS